MKNINLLPPEKKPAGAVIGIAKVLKEISTITLVVLFVTIGVVAALYFTLDARARSNVSREQELLKTIESLNQSEQRLVLIHDRLAKIDIILSDPSAGDQILNFKEVYEFLPEGAVFSKAELTPEGLQVGINTDSSEKLSRFLTSLINSEFSQIDLLAFSYKPDAGYEVLFGIKK